MGQWCQKRSVFGNGNLVSEAISMGLRMLPYTGCRRGEILSLKWEQVRMDKEWLFLPATKNTRSRTVHLNEEAKIVLVELQKRKDQEARTASGD